jgi:hypothetical protein
MRLAASSLISFVSLLIFAVHATRSVRLASTTAKRFSTFNQP